MNTKLPENSLILLEGGSLRGLYTAGVQKRRLRRSISALHRRRFSYFRDQLTSG